MLAALPPRARAAGRSRANRPAGVENASGRKGTAQPPYIGNGTSDRRARPCLVHLPQLLQQPEGPAHHVGHDQVCRHPIWHSLASQGGLLLGEKPLDQFTLAVETLAEAPLPAPSAVRWEVSGRPDPGASLGCDRRRGPCPPARRWADWRRSVRRRYVRRSGRARSDGAADRRRRSWSCAPCVLGRDSNLHSSHDAAMAGVGER